MDFLNSSLSFSPQSFGWVGFKARRGDAADARLQRRATLLCSRFVRCFGVISRFTTSVQSQLRKFVEASLVETGTSVV